METVDVLRKRYPKLHLLVFQRSVEKARNDVELFDILESIPEEMPVLWDEKLRRWVNTDDLMQAKVIGTSKQER